MLGFPYVYAITGIEQTVPGSTFPRSLLAEFDVGARFFADDTLQCHVGRAWRGRTARGGQVAHGRVGASKQSFEDGKRHDDDKRIRSINKDLSSDNGCRLFQSYHPL